MTSTHLYVLQNVLLCNWNKLESIKFEAISCKMSWKYIYFTWQWSQHKFSVRFHGWMGKTNAMCNKPHQRPVTLTSDHGNISVCLCQLIWPNKLALNSHWFGQPLEVYGHFLLSNFNVCMATNMEHGQQPVFWVISSCFYSHCVPQTIANDS